MKDFAIVLVAFVVTQGLVQVPTPSGLFPRAPTKNTNSFVPPKRSPTVDTRAFCGQGQCCWTYRLGGTQAAPNSLPWQVALFIDDKYFNEWILILLPINCAEGAVFFDILLGSHNVRLTAAEEPTRVEVTSFDWYIIHPDWMSLRVRNDVALIMLPAPIKFTPEFQPVCLAPSIELDFVGDILQNSGWGKPSEAATGISPTLNEVYVSCISNDDCALTFGNIIQPGNICTDTTGGHSACNVTLF